MQARYEVEHRCPDIILLDALLNSGESAQDWARELARFPQLFLMTGGPSVGTGIVNLERPVFRKPDSIQDLERDAGRIWLPKIMKSFLEKIGS